MHDSQQTGYGKHVTKLCRQMMVNMMTFVRQNDRQLWQRTPIACASDHILNALFHLSRRHLIQSTLCDPCWKTYQAELTRMWTSSLERQPVFGRRIIGSLCSEHSLVSSMNIGMKDGKLLIGLYMTRCFLFVHSAWSYIDTICSTPSVLLVFQ
jgi:hypothetical protein